MERRVSTRRLRAASAYLNAYAMRGSGFHESRGNFCQTFTVVLERIEVTEKKNASKGGEKKLSKEQIANEEIKSNILNEMEAGKSYTISDMLKSLTCCEMLSQNKVNALVKQLKDEGKVIRTEAKGKAYFTLA